RWFAVDISMGGCTIHTAAELVEGSILQMRLDVPEETSPVRVEAVIIRTLRAGRVGVEFVRFDTVERERLQRFIRGLLLGRWSGKEFFAPITNEAPKWPDGACVPQRLLVNNLCGGQEVSLVFFRVLRGEISMRRRHPISPRAPMQIL